MLRRTHGLYLWSGHMLNINYKETVGGDKSPYADSLMSSLMVFTYVEVSFWFFVYTA